MTSPRTRCSVSCYALLLPVLQATADEAISSPVVERFIGCPVYRDTDAGRKSGCWLVTDPASGIRYDVTSGHLKPILGRMILVEGVVTSTDAKLCGGVVLEPVSVSVLPESCKEHLIPAEGHPGRRFDLPQRTMQPTSMPRTLPPPPYPSREFTIQFDLSSDFLIYQYSEIIIEDAVLYAKASNSRRILITGYAATRPVEVSGRIVREELAIAHARAEMVAEAFRRLGIPHELLKLEARSAAETGAAAEDPLAEAAKRRVVIRIEM